MNSLDLTPTWAGLLPAFFAMLESGTGEGPKIAKEELARLAAFADSVNAKAKAGAADLARMEEEAAEERNRFGLASVSLGRERAAIDLARAGQDFMMQGAFMRAACYWEAAARIAPAAMEEAPGFRVSADLAEREAAALLSASLESARREERGALSEALQNAARDSYDAGQYRAAGAFYRAADMARPSPNLRGMAQDAASIADSEALARRKASEELAAFLDPGRAFSPASDLAPMRAAFAAAFPSSN